MKILIGIPAFITNDLHLDFTRQTINSLQSVHRYDVVLIENVCDFKYKGGLQKLATVIKNPKGNNVSSSWNIAIKEGKKRKAKYVIVSNNDLIFHPKAIDNLVRFADEHPEYILWTAAEHAGLRTLFSYSPEDSFDEHPHFSCFMVKSDFPDMLGEKEADTKEPYPGYFDEDFVPAYFEDGDMHNRILRAGFKAVKTASALFYHYGSRTIKTDPILNRRNADTYEANRRYFQKKWGFDPHGQVVENDAKIRFKFKEPFGP